MPNAYLCDTCGEVIKDDTAIAVSATTGETERNPMYEIAQSVGMPIPDSLKRETPKLASGMFCKVECAITFLMQMIASRSLADPN